MSTGLTPRGPRLRVDGVEQPSVIVYAGEHKVQRFHRSRIVFYVAREGAISERRRREESRRCRVSERVRLIDVVQERPVCLLRCYQRVQPKSQSGGNTASVPDIATRP